MEPLHTWHEYFIASRLAIESLKAFQISKDPKHLADYAFYAERAEFWEREYCTQIVTQ